MLIQYGWNGGGLCSCSENFKRYTHPHYYTPGPRGNREISMIAHKGIDAPPHTGWYKVWSQHINVISIPFMNQSHSSVHKSNDVIYQYWYMIIKMCASSLIPLLFMANYFYILHLKGNFLAVGWTFPRRCMNHLELVPRRWLNHTFLWMLIEYSL